MRLCVACISMPSAYLFAVLGSTSRFAVCGMSLRPAGESARRTVVFNVEAEGKEEEREARDGKKVFSFRSAILAAGRLLGDDTRVEDGYRSYWYGPSSGRLFAAARPLSIASATILCSSCVVSLCALVCCCFCCVVAVGGCFFGGDSISSRLNAAPTPTPVPAPRDTDTALPTGPD